MQDKHSGKDAIRRRTYYDIHCHIYPDAIAAKAVAGIEGFYGGLPGEHADGTAGTLLRLGRETGIERFFVHSVATSPRQVHNINTFIADSASAHPAEFTGLGTLHPDSEDLLSDMEELYSLGLAGVKLHRHPARKLNTQSLVHLNNLFGRNFP